jgi:hypothetical protein
VPGKPINVNELSATLRIKKMNMRKCLLSNFQTPAKRFDKGELWENLVYRFFQENYPDFDFQFLWLYPFDEDFFRRDLNF